MQRYYLSLNMKLRSLSFNNKALGVLGTFLYMWTDHIYQQEKAKIGLFQIFSRKVNINLDVGYFDLKNEVNNVHTPENIFLMKQPTKKAINKMKSLINKWNELNESKQRKKFKYNINSNNCAQSTQEILMNDPDYKKRHSEIKIKPSCLRKKLKISPLFHIVNFKDDVDENMNYIWNICLSTLFMIAAIP